MDILKLSSLVFTILVFISCDVTKFKNEKQKFCEQDSIMHYSGSELKIDFYNPDKQTPEELTHIELYHIRKGKQLAQLHFTRKELHSVKLKDKQLPELHTNDSLKIVLNNTKIIYVTHFKNSASWGGKNFLGCLFFEYTQQGYKSSVLGDHLRMNIVY